MKRSKLFLAGTTCLLAIAGVAATKAHKDVARPVYFTTSRGLCTGAKVTHCSLNTGSIICRTGLDNIGKTLYTKSNATRACNSFTNNASRFNAE